MLHGNRRWLNQIGPDWELKTATEIPFGVTVAATKISLGLMVREVVVASAAAQFLNVPRTLIDAQLGPLVADVLASFADAPTVDVFDELSAEIVRVLGSELAFFRLINTLNCIPDPKPRAECP
ncbi:hypothetical protein Aduo_008262 [Ancylostoma duodenale]